MWMQEAGGAALKPLDLGRSLVDADAEDSGDDSEVILLLYADRFGSVCHESLATCWGRQQSLPS
jgi:hypothetical protein